MKLSTVSLVIASVLLVVSCNSTQVSSTPGPSYKTEGSQDACVDPALNVHDDSDSASAPKTQRSPDSGSEQSGYTEKDPGCILPGLDEK